eukprot:scaffold217_cov377-Prasinococcus_capsulatus_cf.AAC.31
MTSCDESVLDGPQVYLPQDDGAACLDGSPPVMYVRRGFDSGADKLLIMFEGGAWYDDNAGLAPQFSCGARPSRTAMIAAPPLWAPPKTSLRPSTPPTPTLTSIPRCVPRQAGPVILRLRAQRPLSTPLQRNPMMYNWNTVSMHYCDGGSFSGARRETVLMDGEHGSRELFFRGMHNVEAMVSELHRSHNLTSISEVVVSGCRYAGVAAATVVVARRSS